MTHSESRRDDRHEASASEVYHCNDILSVREELAAGRGPLGSAIDKIGSLLAHPLFFAFLAITHVGWLVANLPWMPWEPWDPYPFTFLATVTSAEAPFIALLILMAQERDRRVEELREEVNLQVDLHTQREVTRSLRMLADLHRHLGLEGDPEDDEEFAEMMKPVDAKALLHEVAKRLESVSDDPPGVDDDEA
jgi:uncharacterized membrane protein